MHEEAHAHLPHAAARAVQAPEHRQQAGGAKKRKIANCGIVALDLVQQGDHYCIPEASILPIYLGFS